jgi:hypothetical protein
MTKTQSDGFCSHCGAADATPHASVSECLAALEKEAFTLRHCLQYLQPPVITVSSWVGEKNRHA